MSKTAIITGASGNLGRAVTTKLLVEGYFVAGTFLPGEKNTPEFSTDQFENVIVDLSNEAEAKKMVDNVILKRKNIDAAVLTVGGFAMGKIADTTSADIAQQYKLNFETAYHVARPVFVKMLEQGYGRIFLIGSRPGLDMKNGKGMVSYSLAKSLIFRLAEQMNEEAKGTNVVTSVVVPSTIDTAQNRNSMPDAKTDNWVKPESIADIIHFYCSEAADTLREPVIKVYNNA